MKSLAPVIAVVVLLVVAAFIFLSGESTAPQSPPVASSVTESPVAAPAGVTSDMISAAPRPITPLLSSLANTDKAATGQVAPMLADLVGRLEAKVKTDPANVGNQMLLAQTYSELGRTEEGIAMLRKLVLTKVETPRVSVVLASLLSKSEKSEDWVTALKLLDDATKADAAQTGIAELYRGRVFIAQGKKDLALKTWKAALKRIPATDNAHAQLEQELAKSK